MVCIHKIKHFYMMVCIHDKISYEHKPRPIKKICVSTNILIEIGQVCRQNFLFFNFYLNYPILTMVVQKWQTNLE